MDPKPIGCVDVGFRRMGLVVAIPHRGRISCRGHVVRRPRSLPGASQVAEDVRVASELGRALRGSLLARSGDLGGLLLEVPEGYPSGRRSIFCMGIATGVIGAALDDPHLLVEAYSPRQCKDAVLGRGRLPKGEAKPLVGSALLNRFDWPNLDSIEPGDREHVFDAAATLVAASENGSVLLHSAGWPKELP
jgi:hypothetical protein